MADENVIIYATLTPKAGKETDLETLLRGMCSPSRAESGCIVYDLYRSTKNGTFHFFEIWKTQADIEAHRDEPHFLHEPFLVPRPAIARTPAASVAVAVRRSGGGAGFAVRVRARDQGVFRFRQARRFLRGGDRDARGEGHGAQRVRHCGSGR